MGSDQNLECIYNPICVARSITRYEYEQETGDIQNPELYFSSQENQGLPDGITLDQKGHIWAAFCDGSAVRRIDPSGTITEEIFLPVKQPSSVMFGGPELHDLYITTACEGAADRERGLDARGNLLGDPVYRLQTIYTGRPEWPANFG
jgi:D-xylonolactonase